MKHVAWIVAAAISVLPASANPAVKLLGYDPERVPTEQCESLASRAGLLRVSLLNNGPSVSDRISRYLLVAGHIGEARAVCPDRAKPVQVSLQALGPVNWDATACQMAADAANGTPLLRRKELENVKNAYHPDIIAGYANAVAEALQPIRTICDPHPAFAKLEVTKGDYRSVATSLKSLRGCLLWRKAASREYDVARSLAQTKGRSAGLAHLNGKGLLATAQSKIVCEETAKRNGLVDMTSVQLLQLNLIKTAIEAMPEQPGAR